MKFIGFKNTISLISLFYIPLIVCITFLTLLYLYKNDRKRYVVFYYD